MMTEFKKIVFATVLILCATLTVYADWSPADGHKMHFPQLPNPMGWDIDLRPYELADDWQCSKTGDVNDIHFWISWLGDNVGTIPNFQVKIYSNDPNPPSKPAAQLWSQTIYDFTVRLIDPNGHQGYWIPMGPNSPPQLYPNDHNSYYQVNIKNIQNAFPQVEGQIYWLSLRVPTTSPPAYRVGWKTSLNHFMDAAVVRYTPGPVWKSLYEPNTTMPIDFAFVITGGPNEPNYPTDAKWLQKPDLTNNGIDVMASSPLILADDFECNKSTLITDITIWGSWKYDLPNDVQFTLSIHSDIPVDPNAGNYFSKPGPILWLGDFLPSAVSIERQDINEGWWNPYYGDYITVGDHVCWKYVFHIPEANAFCQKGEPNKPIIYWLDVQAYPNPTSGAQFGWKSSINHWNDDAVWSYGSEPNVGWWEDLHYPYGHPYNPNSIDLAFAIEGNIPCVNEPPEPEVKWRQRPDLTTNGLDIAALDPCTLADDFLCTKSTLITDITIWGSWKNDNLPLNGPNDVWFTLSIHSDIPASQSWTSYSMPNEVLWLRNLMASEVSIERQDINEGWWDPIFMEYLPIGDHTCWKYVFHIPETEAFCQQGEPNWPIVYWLDVQAHPNSPLIGQAEFGWKSSIDHWNDDAVYTYFDEPHTGVWYELRYPTGHPQAGQSIDLAFVIDGNIPCGGEPNEEPNYTPKWRQGPDLSTNGLDVSASDACLILADDFECNESTFITDITIWGSWKNDILPSGNPYNKMHFPQLPNPMGWDIDLRPYELADDWQCTQTGEVNNIDFWISWKGGDANSTISNILVKIYSNDPNIPSKPAQQLWSQTIYDFTIRPIDPNGLEGYWIPTGPNSPPTLYPNDHNSYYQVNIKNIPNAFHQVEGQIYWLSLRVTAAAIPDPNKRVGWKTSLNHFMDAAVVRYTPGLVWKPLYEPNSTIPIDFAFVITGILSPGEPNNVSFILSFHSDIPAGPNTSYSRPGGVLWYRNFTPGTFDVSIEAPAINEGWLKPDSNEYIPVGDHTCWKYVFHVPEANAFCQQGEPNKITYWLDVKASPNDPNAKFGWKSSINHWNDDAVWGKGSEPYIGPWNELRYPSQHPSYPNSIDLAFVIDGDTECNVPPGQATNPNPPDGAINVSLTKILSWTAGAAATSHYVYFGKSTQPPLIGILPQLQTTCNPGLLNSSTTYYWHIDERNPCGTTPGVLYSFTTVLGCMKRPGTFEECDSNIARCREFNDWGVWGEPNCWCFKRQCRGDTNGKKAGLYWVSTADLNLFRSSLSQDDACLATIAWSGVPGICADLNHKKAGLYRVTATDLNIFRTFLSIDEGNVPCCDYNAPGTAPDCNLRDVNDPNEKYNFWTN